MCASLLIFRCKEGLFGSGGNQTTVVCAKSMAQVSHSWRADGSLKFQACNLDIHLEQLQYKVFILTKAKLLQAAP